MTYLKRVGCMHRRA